MKENEWDPKILSQATVTFCVVISTHFSFFCSSPKREMHSKVMGEVLKEKSQGAAVQERFCLNLLAVMEALLDLIYYPEPGNLLILTCLFFCRQLTTVQNTWTGRLNLDCQFLTLILWGEHRICSILEFLKMSSPYM